MPKKKTISFPHLGDYYVPISYLLRKTTKANIVPAPSITKKTIELGTKYSPDFVCIPFKYNLGNYIEALDNGADIIMQAGGGCRYGYYAEVQQQILSDLGYHFEFYTLIDNGKNVVFTAYKVFKKVNKHLFFIKHLHYLMMTFLMINYMDNVDDYIRLNIGFEQEENSFIKLKEEMHNSFIKCNNPFTLYYKYRKYLKKFKKLPINKPDNCLKIGIIGELYTSMEPFASYNLEKELAKMNIEVKRFTNVTYLLIKKRLTTKKMLKEVKDYCKYTIGADGMDNVHRALYLNKKGYDGLIHIKPFGCTPEIGAISILQKVTNDIKIPIIYFTFDNQTSIEGIKTRLEAFYDMLKMKKEHEND